MRDTHLHHLTTTRFTELGLHEHLLKGLEVARFTYCTPIQAAALPLALRGQDVAGQAQTGTGKTAAFLLALMDHLLRHPAKAERRPNQPRALILSPIRELAIQIYKDALQLGQFTPLTLGVVYGGLDYEKQRAMLGRGVDLLIGTPGRIIDYYKQGVFDLRSIEVAVLDEADRMFDLGFIGDVRYLFRRMPKPEQRLTMLFSATLPLRVHEIAYEHMHNPKIVEIAPDKVTADKVSQALYHIESRSKIPLLLGLLERLKPVRTLIFVNTKQAAAEVEAHLSAYGSQVGMISGDVPQRKRQALIRRISRGELPILVATDVAARGLHIPEVSHIINYDLPQSAEDYVHRIGRTARAGLSGEAISLACEQYVYSLMDIEAYLGHKIPALPVTEDLLAIPTPPVQGKQERPGSLKKRRARPRRRAAPVKTDSIE